MSQLTRLTGNGAARTSYEYDSFGNITKFTDPMGEFETYNYNSVGILQSKTDRNKVTTNYTYDSLGRITRQQAGDDWIETSYTKSGLVRTLSNPNLSLTYSYDEFGRLNAESESNGVVKNYGYDLNSNRLSFTMSKNGTQINNSYEYDHLNRLVKVNSSGTAVAQYGYDTNGNRSWLKYNQNGILTNYSYNNANLVTELYNTKNGSSVSYYKYGYYLDGNQSYKNSLHTSTVTDYTYDGTGRLKRESEQGANTVSYGYDKFGNRSVMSVTGQESYAVNYNYDLRNRLISDIKAEDQNTTNKAYSYDNNGSQITEQTDYFAPIGTAETPSIGFTDDLAVFTKKEYNKFNQLVRAYIDGKEAVYTYRPDGLRHSKTVDGVTTYYIWDGQNIVGEYGADNQVTAKYIRGINLILSEDQTGSRKYYLYNAHGDVVQLADVSGNIVKTYDYDAFGVEKDINEQDNNPFRYCAEYYDRETNTVYLRNRYYSPRTGIFTSEDPIRDGLNWYTYCAGNPVAFIDPSGLLTVGQYGSFAKFFISEAFSITANNLSGINIFNVAQKINQTKNLYQELKKLQSYINQGK